MTASPAPLRCLLLQLRDADDRMSDHELVSFERCLYGQPARIEVFDLLDRPLVPADLAGVELILLGGSGSYSAASGGPWFETAVRSLRVAHASSIPTFASCWGFQGMAAAMGGVVVNDRSRAEIGTYEVELTDAGRADAVFGALPSRFKAQMGHEDVVETLPPGTTLLASSPLVVNQAYRFDDRPVYCTQFHPELDADGMRSRLSAYPHYVEEVVGAPYEEVAARFEETTAANGLLQRFVELCVVR
ncbi:MAG: gamma-glutamyl-gamma-aminobutyrate hydrolase family protein [Gemmatimonadetes bacterium]|nr:gamma-glutamyl-gamma-aminobutyrate hydrolase family protein [Gemmatimonadota bacterium]MCY3943335.1 gamma-glutamyl-gamma-aminobutyrate hydrolase family protein [Gemmatimonadota bacterium]